MTAKELLNIAVNYISEYAIDLREARFSGLTDEDAQGAYEWCSGKLSGMTQLVDYLERKIEEEEMII